MLVDTIQAELARLQLHPVNLSVSSKDDRLVAIHGSLLQYSNLPRFLDGQWLRAQLQRLPDAAGPKAVMSELDAAYDQECKDTMVSESRTQLRLFDPQSQFPAARSASTKKDG